MVKEIPTVVIAFLMLCTTLLVYCSQRELNTARMRPLIDVTPIEVKSTGNARRQHTILNLAITNYSGFEARNVRMDLNYNSPENHGWIGEWVKSNKQSKTGIDTNKTYHSYAYFLIGDLDPGKHKTTSISGEFNLKIDVCENKDPKPVLVRITWEGENGSAFDEIQRFDWICNIAKGKMHPTLMKRNPKY